MKFQKILGFVTALLCISLSACSGENGVDGEAGKDAVEVNVDSLAQVLREEITGSLWDTLYSKPYVDTVYTALFDNAFASSWMDSVRKTLVDSLKQADYDSLYAKLYDSVYADIYNQNVIRNLDAWVWTLKENINAAFASQYPLMYKGFVTEEGKDYPVPVSVRVRNQCESSATVQCRWNKIMLKAWISGLTDTASVTKFVNPDDEVLLVPEFKYDYKALLAISSPQNNQIQLRAYALENDREILFYSESKDVTIHPMEVRGTELIGVQNEKWWIGVWVTPAMDSMNTILTQIASSLPNNTLKVYQKYEEDESIVESSSRIVKATFETLQKRGIKYVQNESAGSTGQKIKYPVEILRKKQGICIETTVLFASILEAMGFQTFIIEIPGHAFVGWRTEEDSNVLDFVETTLIGNANATYQDANNSGLERFREEQGMGNFENGSSELIELAKVREYGIIPNDIP